MKTNLIQSQTENVMRLVVLSEPSEAKNQEKKDSDTQASSGIKWWLPFGCQSKKGGVRVGDKHLSTRCGSRACNDCHRSKLRKMMTSAEDVLRVDGETLYALVLTPKETVKTHEDVKKFLSDFRGLLRKWTRSNGLGFGYWVSECVIRKDEFGALARTDILCPVRSGIASGSLQHFNDEGRNAVKDMQRSCNAGESCLYCDGSGYLPEVHLHIHLVVSAESFWFGNGEVPDNKKEWIRRDFGGLGFRGFLDANGMGFAGCQLLRHQGGMSAYISKACINYLSKSYEADDEERQIDWVATQRGTMIASAIYGNSRHRGTVGRSYGVSVSNKNPKNYVTFTRHSAPVVEGQEVLSGGVALHTLKGSIEAHKRAIEVKKLAGAMDAYGEAKNVEHIRMMKIGIKRSRSLIQTNNVLKETQLDKVGEFPTGDVGGFLSGWTGAPIRFDNRGRFRPLGTMPKTGEFSDAWTGVPIVSETDMWIMRMKESNWYTVGKGGSLYSFESPFQGAMMGHHLRAMLGMVEMFDYSWWGFVAHHIDECVREVNTLYFDTDDDCEHWFRDAINETVRAVVRYVNEYEERVSRCVTELGKV